jgi:hypothetical protein
MEDLIVRTTRYLEHCVACAAVAGALKNPSDSERAQAAWEGYYADGLRFWRLHTGTAPLVQADADSCPTLAERVYAVCERAERNDRLAVLGEVA